MTHQTDSNAFRTAMRVLIEHGFDDMAGAIQILINEAMKLERSEFLAAGPYERTVERRGHANGFKDKKVRSRLGKLKLRIPQVRGLPEGQEGFYPKALERGCRSERALKLAVAQMYVEGVSTRKVQEVTRELCGLEVTSSQVSRAARDLDAELERWRTRPLGEFPYIVLDARYELMRHAGSVVSCAVLTAVGVRADGRRAVLGVSVALGEAELHWREFLGSLQERGLHGVRLVVSDDHAGLKAALRARFPGVKWQRCQFHLQRNVLAYVPKKSMRKEVAELLRSIFDSPDRKTADDRLRAVVGRYRKTVPKLAAWIEENVPEGLTVLDLPASHRRRLRTTNLLERIHKEVKRRTRVATLFPNEASVLRLITAILVEISEEWESGRMYLNMESD